VINTHCKWNGLSSPARVSLWLSVWMLTVLLIAAAPPRNALAASTKPSGSTAQCPALLDHQFPRLQDEKTMSLCAFKGQVLLVVNTASYCGFTGQYEELEQLQRQYNARGFNVIGFPSNDFGRQEPKSNKEIAEFCNNTFGVKFPMFAKSSVRGDQSNPLYKQLAKATGEEPGWNFHKYLIDRNGKVIGTFKSGVSPQSPEITQAISRALDAHPITKQ
jgi:glutathione peroxidase